MNMDIKNYSSISAMIANNTMGFTNTIGRSNPIPLDKSSIYNSMADAIAYISSDGTAYDGQIIAIKDATTGIQKAYIVDSTAVSGLTPVGDTSDILPVLDKLSAAISDNVDSIALNRKDIATNTNNITTNTDAIAANLSAITKLSGEFQEFSEISLSGVEAVKEQLAVTVEELESAESGYLKTYIVKQNGTQVGASINIPKDFLVKSATVKECAEANKPVAGYVVGDKYLDFVLNTAETPDGSEEAKHVYIKLTDLAAIYKGGETETITINVVNGVITATLKNDSVTTDHLKANAVTNTKLATDAVTSDKVKNAAIITDKLANGAVTTDKIADENVTTVKIATEAVTDTKLAPDSVITVKIKDSNVTTEKLANGAVTTDKIANGHVTDAKLANNAVITEKILNGAVTKDKLASDLISEIDSFATKSALEDEAKARSDADSELDKRITANATAIANELTVRESAINTVNSKTEKNAQDIAAEVQRAKSAEETLSNTISTEVDRSTKADAKHTEDIGALNTALTLSVTNINTRFDGIDGRINGIAGELTGTYATKDELNSVSDNLALSASNLSDRIDDVEESIDVLNTELTTYAKLSTVNGIDEAVNARIDTVSNSLSDYAKVSTVNAIDEAYKAADNTINARIDAVSNNLSDYTTVTVVSEISNLLKGDIATKLDTATFADLSVKVGLDAASETNKVATQSDISAAVANIAGAMHFVGVKTEVPPKDDTVYKSGDIILVGTKEYVFDGATWIELGDEDLYAKAADLTLETETRISADKLLSNKIDEISANYATNTSVSGIKIELEGKITAEEAARKAADEVLSTAIDNKIFAGANGKLSAVDSLSVVKISQADYHNLVAEEKTNDKVVYIVETEGEQNMYDQRITHLADPIDSTDATNKQYVDTAIQGVKDSAISAITLNGQTFTIANNIASFTIESLNGGNAES